MMTWILGCLRLRVPLALLLVACLLLLVQHLLLLHTKHAWQEEQAHSAALVVEIDHLQAAITLQNQAVEALKASQMRKTARAQRALRLVVRTQRLREQAARNVLAFRPGTNACVDMHRLLQMNLP